MCNRLIKPPRSFNPELVTDLLVILMANVEDAMIMSGASPGLDYERADLLVAATPFVVAMYSRSNDAPAFVTEWPEQDMDL